MCHNSTFSESFDQYNQFFINANAILFIINIVLNRESWNCFKSIGISRIVISKCATYSKAVMCIQFLFALFLFHRQTYYQPPSTYLTISIPPSNFLLFRRMFLFCRSIGRIEKEKNYTKLPKISRQGWSWGQKVGPSLEAMCVCVSGWRGGWILFDHDRGCGR